MISDVKHICVLICFNNYEHIIESFESIYNEKTDFFVIENYSNNSEKIENFFKNKNLVGYIQFNENITNNAVNIFIKNYLNLLENYDYITFTDCDLKVKNSEECFLEIFKILDIENIAVTCVDLETINLPNISGSENWIPKPIRVTDEYIESRTGTHLMTFKKENLWIIENINFLDTNLHNKVISKNEKWVKTLKNKAYHLTWDLYSDNNDYFLYKKEKTHNELWNHNKSSNYKILK